MRRTVSLVVVTGALLALGGVATAGTRLPAPSAPATAPTTLDRAPAPAGTVVGVVERVVEAVRLRPEREAVFRHPGSDYVKVHFSRLDLGPNDVVTVSDPGGAEIHRYDASAEPGWARSVTGDTAVVRLHRGGRSGLLGAVRDLVGLDEPTVIVDQVARGLVPDEAAAVPAPADPGPGWRGPVAGREESLCGGGDDAYDAACYESTHPEIHRRTWPVARLLINGRLLCTAFRVGPGNLMLTNQHCLPTEADAWRTEVWFNYRCAYCQSWATLPPVKVGIAEVVTSDPELDFTLFRVDDFDAVARFGYLELDRGPVEAGEPIYIPQHPMGEPLQVAIEDDGADCVVVNPQSHGYGWFTDTSYRCDTRPGSSGSPVLSRRTHRVIALHHFGGCPNSGVRAELIARYLPEG